MEFSAKAGNETARVFSDDVGAALCGGPLCRTKYPLSLCLHQTLDIALFRPGKAHLFQIGPVLFGALAENQLGVSA